MKVILAYSTTVNDEPAFDDSFIAGYQSLGGVWAGEFATFTVQSYTSILSTLFPHAVANGFSMIVTNAASINAFLSVPANVAALQSYYDQGVILVAPSGTNAFRSNVYTNQIYAPVIVGAGYTENTGGYQCEFFDEDPFKSLSIIEDARQEGTVYNISHIQRVTGGVLAVKLSGVTDVTEIGIDGRDGGHGIPVIFSGVTGTNISPLPNGTIYTTAFSQSADSFSIQLSTSAGTLGTFQEVTGGTLTFGSTDTAKAFFRVDWYGLWQYGILIQGVTGFANSPNGAHSGEVINVDGYSDKFRITHTLGAGSYTGGGTARVDTQSYASPNVAGKIAYMKDTLGISWDLIRKRLRWTAIYPGPRNGFGKPVIASALTTTMTNPDLTPGTLTSSRSGNDITLTFGRVNQADNYEFYRGSTLIATVPVSAGTSTYVYTVAGPVPKNEPLTFRYRVTAGSETGDLSNRTELNWYSASYMLVENEAA